MSFNGEKIPVELKQLPQWVLYKTVRRGGKETKLPYNVYTGKLASTTDSETWGIYEDAVKAVQNGFPGVGFVFSNADPFAGIDLDHCVADDVIEPWAQTIVDRLDSYSELSPSNTGIHVFLKARLPEKSRNRKGNIEMYSKARYFTITGQHLQGTPRSINDRQRELMALYAEIFPDKELHSKREECAGFDPDDATLLEQARRAGNGEKFKRLFDQGETSDYQSPSEADQALCNLLAFWCGPDHARIDRLFRQSALCRGKWTNRADYRQRTIETALERRTEFANGVKRKMDNKRDSPSSDFKDLGLTKKLSDAILKDLAFARDPGGRLYVFDGGVYRPRGEVLVKKKVKRLLEAWDLTAKWSTHRAEETVEYIAVDALELWERPPLDTVNLKNGLLDVYKRQLQPHHPGFLSPVQLPVTYDSVAKCPSWEKFIKETFPEDAQELPWELAAWLMVPDTSIQKAILLLGEGANGKSTFLAALTAFMGKDNVTAVSLHRLESDRFSAARLLGKLANICPDLPSAHLAGSDVFKRITDGQEPVTAERKFKDSFDLSAYARLVFSANHPPRSPDASHAFFRRWLVIPFFRTFDAEEQISRKVLDARLADPAELSGVLNKALDALPDLQKYGFTESESMRSAWNEFREITDPVAVWVDGSTVEESDAMVSKRNLLNAYNTVARSEQRPTMTPMAFGQALKRLRPCIEEAQRVIEGERAWVWLGIQLLGDETTGG